ncbi:MAG: hypothetical protein MJE12_29945 [Alphaproteobacteria bacterium]|nr:hypothetical protein [Alphaproteobacteria bacterium]
MLSNHICRLLALFVSDPLYAKLAFLKNHGWLPRWPHVTLNEYFCHLKSTGELAAYQRYADKWAVRGHVARKVGWQYLVPVHRTVDRLTPEIWEELPESFILKANHGSNWNRIVRNKSKEDYFSVAVQAHKWLKKNFYYRRREQQYRHIIPKIVIEELLTEPNRNCIRDYKLFCFCGKVQFILVKTKDDDDRNYFDRNWNKLDIARGRGFSEEIPRPCNLDEMIKVAETLAEDFTFVRVDLYSVENQIYFGELTFVPGGGDNRFRSIEFEKCAGRLLAGEDVELSRFHYRPTRAATASRLYSRWAERVGRTLGLQRMTGLR